LTIFGDKDFKQKVQDNLQLENECCLETKELFQLVVAYKSLVSLATSSSYNRILELPGFITSRNSIVFLITDVIFFFRRVHTLIGHRGEISNAQFNFDSSFIVTGSMVFVTY